MVFKTASTTENARRNFGSLSALTTEQLSEFINLLVKYLLPFSPAVRMAGAARVAGPVVAASACLFPYVFVEPRRKEWAFLLLRFVGTSGICTPQICASFISNTKHKETYFCISLPGAAPKFKLQSWEQGRDELRITPFTRWATPNVDGAVRHSISTPPGHTLYLLV